MDGSGSGRELWDLVAFLFHSNLADDDRFLMQDGTEQMGNWLLVVMAHAQDFAVDGHGASGQGMLASQPFDDFGIQPVGIDALQAAAKRAL
jgi:hypothetical protein